MVGIRSILGMSQGGWRNRAGAEQGTGDKVPDRVRVVVERIVDGWRGPRSNLTNMDPGVI